MKKFKSFSQKVLDKRRRQRANRKYLLCVKYFGITYLLIFFTYLCFFDTANQKMRNTAYGNIGKYATSVLNYHDNTNGLPEIFYIGPDKWQIIRVDTLGSNIEGITVCSEKAIFYISNVSKLQVKDTIWHEIYHAGACKRGGSTYWNSQSDNPNDHHGIDHLGEFNATFVQDNPELINWLIKK
jgi:hypothetical protein